jgi:hypothetical protein
LLHPYHENNIFFKENIHMKLLTSSVAKKTIAATTALLTAGFVFAQTDVASTDSESSFDSFASDDTGSATPAITFNGRALLDTRAYVDETDIDEFTDLADLPVTGTPSFILGTEYEGSVVSVDGKLKFSENTIKNNPADVIDELTVRANMGNFLLEAGKMKIVWGKGDKLHVLDNFNADDYTDFIIPDYIDRRLSTPMIHTAYSFDKGNIRLEAVYAPVMTTDRFATTGVWVPATYTNLVDKVTAVEKAKLTRALSAYTTATATAGAAAGAASVASTSLTSAQSAVTEATAAKATAYTNYTAAKAAYESAEAAYGTALAAYTASQTPANGAALSTATTNRVAANEVLIGATAALAAATATLESATATEAAYETAATAATTAYAEAATALTTAATNYGTTLAEVSSFSASDMYPDTNTLRYGQAGARITGTIGSFDWGASYYYGHFKQPSVNWSAYIASAEANSGTSYELPTLAYDQKQVFGLEGATAIGRLNFRGEAAYNLTEDTDGTNPWVHNNSVSWVGGFDIDLPVHNLNVNIQETGTYILNNDEITSGTYKTYDVDYNANDAYTNDKLVCNVSDTYFHDKLTTEASVMWGIENGDVIVMPKVTYNVSEGLDLSASGLYIWCKDDNSEFAAWKNNSFLNLGVSCKF